MSLTSGSKTKGYYIADVLLFTGSATRGSKFCTYRTNSMEQSPSRDGYSQSTRQQITRLLWNTRIQYRVYKSPSGSLSWVRLIQHLNLFIWTLSSILICAQNRSISEAGSVSTSVWREYEERGPGKASLKPWVQGMTVARDVLWFEFQRKSYPVLLLTSWCSYNVRIYPLKRSHGATCARLERHWQAKADRETVPLGLARIQPQTAYSALFLGLSWS